MQRVLLVDTDAAEADVLAFVLASHGFAVRSADNLARAHLAADGEPIDLLLVDARLPGAPDLVRGVRALPGNADLVVVALGDEEGGARSAIAATCLARPLAWTLVVATLRQTLRHESRLRRSALAASTTQAA